MRGIILSSMLAVALAIPQVSHAQTGRWKASIGGGLTSPMGDFGDRNKTGGHGTLVVGYSPYHASHTWSFEATFNQLEQINAPEDNLGKTHSNVMVFMGRYDHDLNHNLYVTGGLGMIRDEYRVRFDYVALTNTDSHVGIAGGVGVSLAQRIFVEGRLMYSFSGDQSTLFVPITLGVKF